jgi:uncharacterized protein (TIGR03083 family)
MSELSPDEYFQRLDAEVELLAKTGPDTLTRPIPHITGWTVHSVIGHIGWVLRYVDQCRAAAPEVPPSRAVVGEPPHGPEVLGWFTDAADAVRRSLSSAGLDDLLPTFTGPLKTSWWLRRLSHELALHRWDVEAASGTPGPIDAEQAVDAVDEVLEVYVPTRMHFEVLAGGGETIHLHATDVDHGEWMLTLGPDRVEWEHGHAKGDVAARGTASDLLLLLWSRLPPARLQVFGDATLLERWQTAATI